MPDRKSAIPDTPGPALGKNPLVSRLIDLALLEDIGPGDVTTDAVVPPEARGRGVIFAKETLVVAGLDVAREVFFRMDPDIVFTPVCRDGDRLLPHVPLAELSGGLRGLLTGERVALNFLQRLCGVATHARALVERLSGTEAQLVDTRKTTPGWRALEKYAVRTGGAGNHRMGLYDAVLIKDNHIAACGSLTLAVERAKKAAPFTLKIEVECETLAQVEEALAAGAGIIMLDNMDDSAVAEAARRIADRALVEVSGRVGPERLKTLAELGVNVVSMGALTYGATAVDISMELFKD
jgi:nicotinate-nucleotide pyrophosphorylase (carboxylating)